MDGQKQGHGVGPCLVVSGPELHQTWVSLGAPTCFMETRNWPLEGQCAPTPSPLLTGPFVACLSFLVTSSGTALLFPSVLWCLLWYLAQKAQDIGYVTPGFGG